MMKNAKKYVSEFLGTFALVLVGAGAVVVEGHTGASHGLADAGKVGTVGIALAHGLTLTAMIYSVGSISGGHFNPAISLAAWIRKRLTADLVIGYMLAQFLGAIVAALLLGAVFPDEVGLAQLGTPALGPRISALQGFAIEGAITFLLTVVVLSSTRSDNESSHAFAGLAIGATLIGLILFAGPLTGGAANPARYLGPAIVSRNLDAIWLYVLAPLYGGTLAAFVIGVGVEMRGAAAPLRDTKEPHRGTASPRLGRALPRGGPGDSQPSRDPAEDVEQDNIAPLALRQRAKKQRRAQEAFKKAQELYFGGHGEEAAASLVPLLARATRGGGVINDQVRSLLLVIEDTHGRLAILDGYRQFLDRPHAPPTP
jgi:MIP family channel proteins